MKNITHKLLPLLLLMSVSSAYADSELDELRGYKNLSNEWQVKKTDRLHQIITYVKQEDDKKYRSFKVEAEVNASMDAIAKATFDIDSYTKWFWKVREAKMLQKISETEFIYYMINEAPTGNPDRDVVVRLTIEPYTKAKGVVRWKTTALPDYISPKPPLVRMTSFEQLVTVTPISDNKTHVVSEGYVNPGGAAPTWAINFIQKQAPYYIMLGFQRVAQKDEYNDSSKPVPFKIRAD